MKQIGRWIYEVTCPLCLNIYLCEYNEVYYDIVKDEEGETRKPYFYCPSCNRNIWLDVDGVRYLRDARLSIKNKKGD